MSSINYYQIAKAYSDPQKDRNGFQYISDLLFYLCGGHYNVGIVTRSANPKEHDESNTKTPPTAENVGCL